MEKYKGFKIGDAVTVREPQRGYYSDKEDIIPGMIGNIMAFPAKVTQFKGAVDRSMYFAKVIFVEVGKEAGILIPNLKKVRTK